jgi:hypothetical protein
MRNQSIKVTASATMKKSESNDRLNECKNRKSTVFKSNSCEQLRRKSSSFDNLKKMKKVSSTSSLYENLNNNQPKPMGLNDDDLQGFKVDEYTDSFLNEHAYLHDEEDTCCNGDLNNTELEKNNENDSKDDINNSSTSANMIKHLAATNCPGIIYDCIQKKDEIIECPANILHIVQDHVTSQAIQCLSDHIFHM